MIIHFPNSSSKDEKTFQEEEKEKLTRREKKRQNNYYFMRSKYGKFDVPDDDTINTHYRRGKHKNKKTLSKPLRQIKQFDKAALIFSHWLKENIDRFSIKPIKVSESKYYFEGVIKNVSLRLNWSPESMIFFDSFVPNDNDDADTNFDHYVVEYIGIEKHHPEKGFYDGDSTDEVYDYFPTREALYTHTVFEPIIAYCNEYITPEHSLYLFDYYGSTSAFIEKTDESSEVVNRRVVGDGFIDDLNEQACEKLCLEEKAYKIIKYELFGGNKAPLIRYHRRSA